MPCRLLCCLFPPAVLLACAAVFADDGKPAVTPDAAAVRKLIDRLGSDDFETRDRAAKELEKLDEVPDALKQATKSNDAEVRRLARGAIDAITDRVEDRAFKEMMAD